MISARLIVALPIAVASAAAWPQHLNTVVVTASRTEQAIERTLSDVVVIERDEIASHAGATLAELLRARGGIEISETGGAGRIAGMFVRGTRTSQTVVMLDGLRLDNPSNGGASIEFLPLSIIERIEIVKGPSSSLYGSGAIGGVVQIFTRRGGKYWNVGIGGGNRGLARAHASIGHTAGATSVQAAFSSDRGPTVEVTDPGNSDYQADLDRSRQTGVRLHLSHSFSRALELSLGAVDTRGESDYDSAFSSPADTRLKFGTRVLSSALRLRASERWQSTVRVGESRIDYTFAAFVFAPRTRTRSAVWENAYSVGDAEWLFGLERLNQSMVGDGVDNGASPYLATQRTTRSAFIGYSWQHGAHLARLNARRDVIGGLDGRTTGLLAYGYRIAPKWLVRLSVGSAFRAPTFDDLYAPFGSNPSLRPERARAAELAVERRSKGLTARALFFANRIVDAIELDDLFIPRNLAKAKVTGLTFDVDALWRRWRLDASVTFQRARAEQLDPATGSMVERALARRGKRYASLGVRYVRGSWQTGLRVVAQAERFEASGQPIAGYAAADADFRYRLRDGIDLGISVTNIGATRYATAANYPAPGRIVFVSIRVGSDR